jgi:hypothetical protein
MDSKDGGYYMEKSNKLSKVYLGITKGAFHTLLVIFIFGMIANLYIEIPSGLVDQAAWAWVFGNSAIIVIHAVLGILVLLVAVASLVVGFLTHRTGWIVASLLGLLFTILAAYSGSDFITNGGANLSSLLMALGFLGALVSYATAAFQSKLIK